MKHPHPIPRRQARHARPQPRPARTGLALLASLALFSQAAHAQSTATSANPTPPLSLTPPATARWEITFEQRRPHGPATPAPADRARATGPAQDPAADPAAAATVVKGRYTLTGKTATAQLTYADGRREELFLLEDMILFEDPALQRVRVHKIDQYSPEEMRFAQRYPGLDWVSRDWFRGVVEKGGRRLLWFRQEPGTGTREQRPTDPLVYDNRFATEGREAWFDAATLLPDSFRTGDLLGTYRHLPPPTTPISIPRRHAHAVQFYLGLVPSPIPPD